MTLRVGIPISTHLLVGLPPNLHPVGAMSDTLNLTTHRAPSSVWDRRGWDGTREQLAMTRWLLGVGGSVAWWALTGEGDLSDARRFLAHLVERTGWRRDDLVHDASADSFPASDAPAWTPTVGTGLRGRARGR